MLQVLYKTTPKKRKHMIESLSDDTGNALCECACNIKSGNAPITAQQYKSLSPYHKQVKLGFLLKPIAQMLLGGL